MSLSVQGFDNNCLEDQRAFGSPTGIDATGTQSRPFFQRVQGLHQESVLLVPDTADSA